MSTPHRLTDPAHARRILVTIVIATAALAVTAGLATNRHHRSIVVKRAEAASPAAEPAPTAGRRPVGTPSDPSRPTAAEAIERIEREAAESPPTF